MLSRRTLSNAWLDNAEMIASKHIVRETVQNVSDISEYYVAYRLIAELTAKRLLWFVVTACVCWNCSVPGYAQTAPDYLDAAVAPRSGIPCPSPESYSPTRPDPPGVPTVVGLGIIFVDILGFDDVNQSLAGDAYVLVRWRDGRLADPERGDGSADCPPPGPELWSPAIEPDNLRSRQSFYDPRFLVDGNGTVTLARRALFEVANNLDLHDFPLDRHHFRVTLWPTTSRSDEVRLYPMARFTSMSPDESLQGWSLGPPVASVEEAERLGRIGRFWRYDLTIEMSRDWGYYSLKLGVPLLLIVLMAYCVYFIPPAHLAQQVSVSTTAMLTLIAYMLALAGSLPKISYLTRAERFFVGCALLVFLGLLKATLTSVWVQRDQQHLIRMVDRTGRWLFPMALLLVALVAFVF